MGTFILGTSTLVGLDWSPNKEDLRGSLHEFKQSIISFIKTSSTFSEDMKADDRFIHNDVLKQVVADPEDYSLLVIEDYTLHRIPPESVVMFDIQTLGKYYSSEIYYVPKEDHDSMLLELSQELFNATVHNVKKSRGKKAG